MAYEHEGHRKRMYEKAAKQSLLDWELMELVLYLCVPRRNTVDLAHSLLNKFGSAVAVFFAPLEELRSVKGVGENVANGLFVMGEVYRRHFKVVYDPFAGRFKLEEFLLRAADMYKAETNEVLDVYLLNEDNRVISRHRRTDELQGQVALDTKWLGKLLADEEVYGVVMVHNHPTGSPHFSGHDEVATCACQTACNMHGKVLCDHVIFSPDGVYSYYKQGRLEEISVEYSFDNLVKQKVVQDWLEKSADMREGATERFLYGKEE